ncbi:Glycosyl hydrolase superfamily protein [Abeliophyllum distichum]|uniref:Glycosyl hydrolase superfamily protein n=1 Tax=Abeliophyllum distichum TaxID=126358 RepID=A0ABD1RUK4_9LAMI
MAVGNEVSPLKGDTSQFVPFVFPAIRNIQTAISAVGLGNQIKVSTYIEIGVLGNSYPLSDGVFLPEVRQYLGGIIQFLVNNRAPLLVNIYPYFTSIGSQQQISLDYALFMSTGIVMPDGT